MNKRRAYLLFTLSFLFIYLIAGLYPFQFKTPWSQQLDNGVVSTPDQALHFLSPGIAYTKDAPSWLPHAIAASSLELSLEVRTAEREQEGPARIFTLSLNPFFTNLTVAQQGTSLSVRMRNRYTNLSGRPDYWVSEVFSDRDWHQIDIRITSKTLEIRIDKNTFAAIPLPDRPFESWNPSYRLALGNELSGDRPWRGSIRKAVVRIRDKSFDYLVPNALHVPESFIIESTKAIHLVPFINAQYSRANFVDWTINLFGFMPFGWLLVMYRRPRPGVFLAIILSAGVSATIEASQLFLLADRSPSTEDLILNTFGGAIGAWLGKHYDFSIRKRRT